MIKIDGVAKRNLQEQVGYNSEQIDKIFELLDGLNVQDNLIKLTASSGILSAEDMVIVERDVAFIVYNNNVYIKSSTSVTEYVFKQIALSASDQGTYNILQSFRIVVTRASGAYAYSSNTVLSVYNKSEMDTLLSGKANSGESYTKAKEDSLLAQKASLNGADFTGPVTATTIEQSEANWSKELNSASYYVNTGVDVLSIYSRLFVMNNILYVVLLGRMTNNTGSTLTPNLRIQGIDLPANIANKIYDYGGNKVSDAPLSPKNISIGSGILTNSDYGGTISIEAGKIINNSTANRLDIFLPTKSLSDGDTVYFEYRAFLCLI